MQGCLYPQAGGSDSPHINKINANLHYNNLLFKIVVKIYFLNSLFYDCVEFCLLNLSLKNYKVIFFMLTYLYFVLKIYTSYLLENNIKRLNLTYKY